MMDECFSKLDSNNSRNLMSFLVNTLNIQIIAAAPPGKYSDIADSIPTVWHVVQSEDRRERQCFFYTKEEYLAKLEAGEEDGDE